MDFLTQLPIESNSKTIFIALLLVFVALLYWYSVFPYTQLERIGVKHPKPWPFFGNIFIFQKGFWDAHQELIRKYGRVCGYYLGRRPVIVVSDPDMIKQILVKDFSNFPNRMHFRMTTKPLSESIILLRDERWKKVRSVLTPTFSAAKMKEMVPLINIAADTLVENLKVYADSGQSFNIHKCLGCFTMDVIASVAFGTQVNSQKNPENPFVKHAQTFFSFTFFRPLAMILIAFPFLISPLIWIVPNKRRDNLNNFFISFIKNIIKERDNQSPNERRRDFLQLMLDARNSTECASLENFDLVHHTDDISGDVQTTTASKKVQKTTLTENEIMGQGFIFLLAGYETTSSTLAFACYMLAIYQDCQKMVIKEVDDFFSRHEVLDYNNVQELPYLDQVISETLRLFPPGFRFARDASRDCVVNGQFIPRGVTIEIPAGYIHYNPEYWPEPEKFIPERFTQEAKAKRHPFTYLPFGAGPRSCIAMRLALLEVKIAMVRLLQQYTFETCPDTKIPVELKSSSTLAPKDGIFLKIVHRYK
ncbi:thromboxane-A synthase isoform X2 [Polypterus senegalus]|uniref:thromboxane-A synthase isoform X2 n=2 Tax=Polypterus senegalus TaxID=55291 RepID=UPI0019627609|nr:thromboxane-A synthase isoform X2 [Polypterus senegalus]